MISTAEIVDYKNGRTPVFPDSEQLKVYGAGTVARFMDPFDSAYPFDTIRLAICQPNMDPEGSREWETRVEDCDLPEGATAIGYESAEDVYWAEYPVEVLIEQVKEIGRILDLADDPDAPATPGQKQCMFCKGKRGATPCRAYVEWSMEPPGDAADLDSVRELFGINLDAPETMVPAVTDAMSRVTSDTLTPEQHAALYKVAPLLESMLKAIKESALARHQGGERLPGLKAVAGRKGNKKWLDENVALKKVSGMTVNGKKVGKTNITVEKLMTPTQVEKAILAGVTEVKTKKQVQEKLKKLYDQGEAKPILVDINDEREELGGNLEEAQEVFGANPNETTEPSAPADIFDL